MFNKDEVKYLKSQFLARIATATPKGKPNVAPVGFEFDGKYFYIGSIKQEILHSTPRYLNIKNGNGGALEAARGQGERSGRCRRAQGRVRQGRLHPDQTQALLELGTS
jgi:hypothetical protein